MIYAMLAGGSKGFELFPPKFEDPNGKYTQAIGNLLEELASLQPLLAISDPVQLLESEEPDDFLVRTLLCGDKGVLLFVLPSKEDVDVRGRARLRVRQPGFSLCAEAYEVGGNEGVSIDPLDPQHYLADVPLVEQARLYFVPACQ